MRKFALLLSGASLAVITMVGCTVNQPPDVIQTPADHTTIVHDKTSPAPTINVTPPASSSSQTTTTTTPPDGSGTSSTTTTHTTG